jgi:hypothetical protein
MEGSRHNGNEYQAQELGFLAWIIPIRGEDGLGVRSSPQLGELIGVLFGSSSGGQILCRELKLD